MEKGFTLLEMVVSIGIFSVLVILSIGAMLGVQSAQLKASSVQALQDNLRFSLESITKEIRSGTDYQGFGCDIIGCSELRFTRADGIKVGYCVHGGFIKKLDEGEPCEAGASITSDQVEIRNLIFLLRGTAPGAGDGQSRVTISIVVRSKNEKTGVVEVPLQTSITSRIREL